MFYVRTERINGRFRLALLCAELRSKGFGERVEYNEGGWHDNSLKLVAPHLRFKNGDDAMAYALSVGQAVLKTLPYMEEEQ